MSPPRTAVKRVTTSTLAEGAHVYPAFYACYMLRSFKDGKMNRRTYIGSTPDPPRRWRQHNGEIQGGAFRTKFWRPWEMDVICYDFPSKLVALQFEWAWNAPYKSRHLRASGSDDKKPIPRFPKSIGTGPEARIRVLQAMLSTKPWCQYPLKVMLFSSETRDIWDRCARGEVFKKASKKWGATDGEENDIASTEVHERFSGVDGHRLVRRKVGDAVTPSLSVADGDAVIEAYEKLQQVLEEDAKPPCGLCGDAVDIKDPLSYAVCSITPTCHHIAHFSCLAPHFLGSEPDQVLPDHGECPGCRQSVRWGQLVKASFHRQPVKPSAARPTTARKGKRKATAGAASDMDASGDEAESPTRRKRKSPVKVAAKKKTSSPRVATRTRAKKPASSRPTSRMTSKKKVSKAASDTDSSDDFGAALDAIAEDPVSTPVRKRRSPKKIVSSVESIGGVVRAVDALEVSPTTRGKRKATG